MSIHFNLIFLHMSILFSNFAVRKERTLSPPETRLIGYNMLHAEFHIFEECDRYAFANNLRTILRENGQKDYQVSTYGTQVILVIGNLYSYAISFHLISCIEQMRVQHEISGYLSLIEYTS